MGGTKTRGKSSIKIIPTLKSEEFEEAIKRVDDIYDLQALYFFLLMFFLLIIFQINGVDENGYCEECSVIKVQTFPYAVHLQEMRDDNTLDNYYQSRLASYEFKMRDVYQQLTTGVEFYSIENNTITKYLNNDED